LREQGFGRLYIPEPRGIGFNILDCNPHPGSDLKYGTEFIGPEQGLSAADVHGSASQRANGLEVFFGRIRIDIVFLPMRAAIIQTMFATGSAEIIGNQTTGSKLIYREFKHLGYLSILEYLDH